MKLLASDYDGTLRRQEVAQSEIEAIRKFQSEGNLFGIVTGRAVDMILEELRQFNVPFDFLICNNGAIVADKNGKRITSWDMDYQKAMEFIEHFPPLAEAMLGLSNGIEYHRLQTTQRTYQAKNYNVPVGKGPSSLEEVLREKRINSFFLRGKDEPETWRLKKQFEQAYGDWMDFHFNNGTLDISRAGVNKATGVQYLQSQYPEADVQVIGDGYNDVEMIATFHGYAMENGVEEAKQVAKKIVTSVAQCIQDLMQQT